MQKTSSWCLSSSQLVLVVKNLPANPWDIRDVSSVPGSGRSPWRRAQQSRHIVFFCFVLFPFFPFIFISWRLITLQCCSGFCHTLTWISHVLRQYLNNSSWQSAVHRAASCYHKRRTRARIRMRHVWQNWILSSCNILLFSSSWIFSHWFQFLTFF